MCGGGGSDLSVGGGVVVDAEIEIELGPGPRSGEYGAKVLRAASGGEPESTFALDVDGLVNRSRTLETTVLASAARARGPVVPELEKPLRQVGSELFRALFAGPIGTAYRASLAVARERGKKLRVVLRITAPELAVMPWEALYDEELQAYICRTEPLVRHIDAPYSPEPLPVRPPLRILGIVASPRGLPELNVDAEKQRLEQALAAPNAAGQVQVEWLTQASWSSVHERLLREQWHVLHFIGHGDYDPERGEGRIALVRDDGRADWVDATSLADLLDEADPTPRLVVLNSCASAQGGSHDLFSGTAATLVHRGISAVAAMQFSVSDTAAVAFPRGFYTALAGGRSVDEAVRSGRIEILGTGRGTLEWVTPVLHVRGDATRLFDLIERPPGAAAAPLPSAEDRLDLVADPQWADALGAFFAKRWPEAVQRFEALHARYPGEARVETRLDEARRQRDIAAWSDKADTAAADGDWDTVVSALENLIALDQTYPDAVARLEQARTAQRRKTLLDEMTALHQVGRWEAVVAAAQELARIDPDNPDPGGIVSDAKTQIRDAELADRYAQALNHLDQQHWQQAVDLLTAIEQENPGYRDAAALLKTAQHNLEAARAEAPQPATPPASPPPLVERINRRTTIMLAAVALPVVGAVGVMAILLVSHKPGQGASSQPGSPSSQVLSQPGSPSSQVVLPFTGLQPQGVAVDSAGNLYVTDVVNRGRVLKLAAGASTQTELPFTGLSYPEGVAVDGAGNLYVTDYGNNRVLKLPAGASTPTELPFTDLRGPQGVAVDSAGNLYVADYGTKGVLKLPAGATTQDVLPFTDLRGPRVWRWTAPATSTSPTSATTATVAC